MPPTPKSALEFYVNGEKVTVDDVHPQQTLLEFLRNDLQLCGAKLGCGEGGCGACTVMVSRFNKTSHETEHSSIVSCLTPICSLHGAAITTIEGVGSTKSKLHPVQEALAHRHGTQCGYCSPGMVMSMCSLLQANPQPQLQDIEDAVQGNLCRCTGYRPIMECFKSFAKDGGSANNGSTPSIAFGNDEHLHGNDQNGRHSSSQRRGGGLRRCFGRKNGDSGETTFVRFDNKEVSWVQPGTLEKLIELKAKHPEGILVAGNTQVGLRMKIQHEQFPILISVMGIPELYSIKPIRNGVEFGAAVSLTALENYAQSLLAKEPPHKVASFAAIVKLFRTFTGRQIKNMSTVGGTIMASLAAADMIPVCLAANSTIRLASKGSSRDVPLDELFSVENQSRPLIEQKEVVVALTIPFTSENECMAAFKQTGRQATIKSCMKVEFDGNSEKVRDIRLAFSGVGPRAVLAEKTMKKLKGMCWTDSLLAEASHLLEEEFPSSGTTNKAKYQKLLITSYFFKFYCIVLRELNKKQIKVESGVVMPPDTMDTADSINKPKPLKSMQLFPKVPSSQSEDDGVGRPLHHKFGEEHTTGEAVYCDDIPKFKNELYMGLVLSKRAHAKIVSVDIQPALAMDGVKMVLTSKDLLGERNLFGYINKDDLVFAEDKVTCVGQTIAAVMAKDKDTAQAAARAVVVQYEDLPALLTIEDAIAACSYLDYENKVDDGDVENGLTTASQVIEGQVSLPGQKHFYMETQSILVVPKREKRDLEIFAAVQDLTGVQVAVSHALDLPAHHIICRIKRLGGGFGGKSTRAIPMAVAASLAAQKLQLPIRCKLDRQEDMAFVGGRHPYLAKYKVGFSPEGKIQALDLQLFSDAGNSTDLSTIIMIFTVTSSDNSYKIPNLRIRGKCCRTNLPSNTAFRGFGALQGFTIIEYIIDHVATVLNLDPVKVRQLNLYKEGDLSFYHEELTNVTIGQCWQQCMQNSHFEDRRRAAASFNRSNQWRKRGISVIPLRFGVGFPVAFLNQGCALVNVYTDGSVLLCHGGIEMGQGLHTKMIQVASRALHIPDSKIYTVDNSTDRVPNAVVTAASTGSDLNGAAVLDACNKILERLEPFRQSNPQGKWEDWVTAAYFDRVSLSATGFYKVPDLDFNDETKRGRIFTYDAYGVGCTEVELDCLTGDHKILRTDIVIDAGVSLNPMLDIGQLEGAFMQGYGYYITEDVQYTAGGAITTTGPLTYRIPTFKDIPEELNVSLLEGSSNPKAIYSSKSIGEPPLCLSASIYFAIKDAITDARRGAGLSSVFHLGLPATPDKIRLACSDQLPHQLRMRATQ